MTVFIIEDKAIWLQRMEDALVSLDATLEVKGYNNDVKFINGIQEHTVAGQLQEIIVILDLQMPISTGNYWSAPKGENCTFLEAKYKNYSVHGLNIYRHLRHKYRTLKMVIVSSHPPNNINGLTDGDGLPKDSYLLYIHRSDTFTDMQKVLKFSKLNPQ